MKGNICRCGEYAKVYTAVETAAGEMRNPPAQPQVLLGPPPPHTGNPATATYQFANPLGSDEFIGEVNFLAAVSFVVQPPAGPLRKK